MQLQEYDLTNPPKIDYKDAALAMGIRPERVPPIEVQTEPSFEDMLDQLVGRAGGQLAQFNQLHGPLGTMEVNLVNYDALAKQGAEKLANMTREEGLAKGFAPLEDIIAHELVHAKQLQDWLDAGHTVKEWTKRILAENSAAAGSYDAYRAIPEEAEAFKRGPLFAHLVKITTR